MRPVPCRARRVRSQVHRLVAPLLVVLVVGGCGARTWRRRPRRQVHRAPRLRPRQWPTLRHRQPPARRTSYPIFVSSEILAGHEPLPVLADRCREQARGGTGRAGHARVLRRRRRREQPSPSPRTRGSCGRCPTSEGLYAADVEFPKAGRWGVRFTATFPDGRQEQVRADFDVAETGPTPGDRRPGGLRRYADGRRRRRRPRQGLDGPGSPTPPSTGTSVADALAAKQPFVLVFATPGVLPDRHVRPDAREREGGRRRLPDAHVHQRRAVQDGLHRGPPPAGARRRASSRPRPGPMPGACAPSPGSSSSTGTGKVTAKFEAAVARGRAARRLRRRRARRRAASTGLVTAVDQPSITKVDASRCGPTPARSSCSASARSTSATAGFNAGPPARAHGDEHADQRRVRRSPMVCGSRPASLTPRALISVLDDGRGLTPEPQAPSGRHGMGGRHIAEVSCRRRSSIAAVVGGLGVVRGGGRPRGARGSAWRGLWRRPRRRLGGRPWRVTDRRLGAWGRGDGRGG